MRREPWSSCSTASVAWRYLARQLHLYRSVNLVKTHTMIAHCNTRKWQNISMPDSVGESGATHSFRHSDFLQLHPSSEAACTEGARTKRIRDSGGQGSRAATMIDGVPTLAIAPRQHGTQETRTRKLLRRRAGGPNGRRDHWP